MTTTSKSFVTHRLYRLIGIFLGVSVITFALIDLMPGDAAEMVLSAQLDGASAEKITELRKEMGLDVPLPIRYLHWLRRTLMLDFGTSFRTGEPVSQEILHRLPTTLTLAGCTFVFTVFFSLAGGNGFTPFILPVLTLGLSISAADGRIFRASILEILTQNYVLFAYAKGLSRIKVFLRHVFKAALLPMLSIWGMLLGHLLGGAVIVESVFSLPGLGKLAADSVLYRDIPMIQGTVLTMTLFFILSSWGMDMLYYLIFPQSHIPHVDT